MTKSAKTRRNAGRSDKPPVAERSRRTRRKLDPADVDKMIRDRFSTDGKSFPSNKEIGARYGRDSQVVSRAIFSAFKEGRVRLHFSDRVDASSRDSILEKRLVGSYGGLREAIVVNMESIDSASAQLDAAHDDKLHQRLGAALAHEIASTGSKIFRDGDIIGLGSGRGVFETAEALRRADTEFLARDVTLVSLTGEVDVQHHERRRALLDANPILSQFGLCFRRGCGFRPVRSYITCKPQELKKYREEFGLNVEQGDPRCPNVAIVGVGVLAPGHRFYEAVRPRDPGAAPREIAGIQKQLSDLVDLCEKVGEPNQTPPYCPVSDICNLLYLVPPPPDIPVDEEAIEQIRRLIEEINQRILTVSERELKAIQTMTVVAGGKQKALAIRQFLNREELSIHCLCTDAATANCLV